jgi:hypothetical protein
MKLTEFYEHLNTPTVCSFEEMNKLLMYGYSDDLENKDKWDWENALFMGYTLPSADFILNYKFSSDAWKYIRERYNNCLCPFAKSVYGTFIFLAQKDQDNRFKADLLNTVLVFLSQTWPNNIKAPKISFLEYYPFVKIAMTLARKLKKTESLNKLLSDSFNHHQEWEISADSSMMQRVMIDYTNLFVEYFKESKDLINIPEIIAKNHEAEEELRKSYIEGAVYIEMSSIPLIQKLQLDVKESYKIIGSLKEEKGNLADTNVKGFFYHQAMYNYKKAGYDEGLKRVEQLYIKTRGDFKLEQIVVPLPDDDSKKIDQELKNLLDSSDKENIFDNIILEFRILNWSNIFETAKTHSDLALFFSSSALDKFGNQISIPQNDEERIELQTWNNYSAMFKLQLQCFANLFNRAVIDKKITYNSFINYLEKTWVSASFQQNYTTGVVEIIPLDNLKPSLKLFFDELQDSINDKRDTLNNTSIIIDSMTLKIEYLLRYLCVKENISTCKLHDSKGQIVTMEKLLDDILADLKDSCSQFTEDHFRLLKFVLTPKGFNLRNSVAHGLLDPIEYNPLYIYALLYIILILSKL